MRQFISHLILILGMLIGGNNSLALCSGVTQLQDVKGDKPVQEGPKKLYFTPCCVLVAALAVLIYKVKTYDTECDSEEICSVPCKLPYSMTQWGQRRQIRHNEYLEENINAFALDPENPNEDQLIQSLRSNWAKYKQASDAYLDVPEHFNIPESEFLEHIDKLKVLGELFTEITSTEWLLENRYVIAQYCQWLQDHKNELDALEAQAAQGEE